MDPTLERAILELRADMDEGDAAAFESDLRAALAIEPPKRDKALEVVVRSWTSRRELQGAPEAPSWFS
jgi:hypothetical protein